MPDWTHTLELRQLGSREGFLSNDIPLEEQDPHEGGPLVNQQPADDDPLKALDLMTKAELVDEAAERGVEISANATKAEIIDALRN